MQRPTLAELRTRILSDLAARTAGRAYLRRSVEGVLAPVLAALAHGLYGAVEWAVDQQLPSSADELALVRWGQLLNVPRIGGTRATGGQVALTGAAGTRIVAGTNLRTATGTLLATTADVVLTNLPTTVAVNAIEVGTGGNVAVDELVTVQTTVRGLDSQATMTVATTGGAGLEDLELYRGRVLDALRKPPRGGGPGDYRAWALEVPGVSGAWEYPHRAGVGTVSVAITRDQPSGDSINRIPDPAFVATVQAHLDARRPLDMRAVIVRAPIAQAVNLTIDAQPKTTANREAILVELRRLFYELAPMTTLSQSLVDEAISSAPTETSHSITAIGSLVPADWRLLTLGTVTFTGIA
jgi:uncharacterized phage protein gp47/JayE